MARNHPELLVWRKAMELAEGACPIANLLPDVERFGLAAQLRRAAVSVLDETSLEHAEGLADETGRLLRSIERALRASIVAEDSAQYDPIQPSALSPRPS